MEEIIEKKSEVGSAANIKKEVREFVPAPYEAPKVADDLDQDLEKSLYDMDNKVNDVSTIEAKNDSPESIRLEASRIWNSLKKAFDNAATKLSEDPKSFSFYLDGQTVSVSIEEWYRVLEGGTYTDYHTYVPAKYLNISVSRPDGTITTCKIGFWKEKRASAFKTEHDWVSVYVSSGKTVKVNEICRCDKEFKSVASSIIANNYLGLANRVSLQTSSIINNLYKKEQTK